MSEWISVKDRLPENMEEVLLLVTNYNSTICIQGYAFYELFNHPNPEEDVFFEYRIPEITIDSEEITVHITNTLLKLKKDEVTHWMPLPASPKKK